MIMCAISRTMEQCKKSKQMPLTADLMNLFLAIGMFQKDRHGHDLTELSSVAC